MKFKFPVSGGAGPCPDCCCKQNVDPCTRCNELVTKFNAGELAISVTFSGWFKQCIGSSPFIDGCSTMNGTFSASWGNYQVSSAPCTCSATTIASNAYWFAPCLSDTTGGSPCDGGSVWTLCTNLVGFGCVCEGMPAGMIGLTLSVAGPPGSANSWAGNFLVPANGWAGSYSLTGGGSCAFCVMAAPAEIESGCTVPGSCVVNIS